jgi:hypothetical protein
MESRPASVGQPDHTCLADSDPAVSGRVFAAMQNMVKLDIATLERAAVG